MPAPTTILAGLATAIVAWQERIGAGPAAVRAAAALSTGARAVVTGQQPGLLGGPLLALHKAVGAIVEARRRTTAGTPTVPVFWVHGDDHDWDEVNTATVMDASGAPRVLALDVAGDGRSVADVALDAPAVEAVLAALAAALPSTERAREAVALAQPASYPTDLATWWTTVVLRLLGDAGLVIVTPALLAPYAGEVFARLVRDGARVADVVRAEGVRRRAAGEIAPLDPSPGDLPLFLREGRGGRRRRVALDGERVVVRGAPRDLDRRGLEALVRAEPVLASGDVVGRVLLQAALLPVDAYVAGPTEAAYQRQLGPAHAVLGLAAPAIVERPSAVWLERRHVEALAEAGFDVGSLLRGGPPPPAPAVPLVDDDDGARLAAWAADAATMSTRLRAEAGVARALGEASRALEAAREAHRRARAGDGERATTRRARAIDAVLPRGKPQERVLSPLSIVARHGVEALRRGLFRDGLVGGGSAPRTIVLDPAGPGPSPA